MVYKLCFLNCSVLNKLSYLGLPNTVSYNDRIRFQLIAQTYVYEITRYTSGILSLPEILHNLEYVRVYDEDMRKSTLVYLKF